MKKIFMTFLGLSMVVLSWAQHASETYSRIQIHLGSKGIQPLTALGLDTDHGIRIGNHLISEVSETEQQAIKAAGYSIKVLVADLKAQPPAHTRNLPDCPTGNAPLSNWQTPANYTGGTMGGYPTLAQAYAILDDMKAKFPNLISTRTVIPNHLTYEGRPIYWVRISDNPEQDEPTEEEVLYTALHHAREPNGLSQMLFYMWYLLEHYQAGDTEIQYLLNNTALYFIPCINPDGYVYNETTDPLGNGYWRKNRFPHPNGNDVGVDLNRNYGHQWGFDDNGSSSNPQSEVYRGANDFSEAETQAIRDFVNGHDFKIALNYHTFSNLLINPWAWADMPTPDSAYFNAYGRLMVAENNYKRGLASETVGYQVNGSSDDWMYGDNTLRPKVFAYTPEVGETFWPNPADIDRLNKDCMHMNLTAVRLLHTLGVITPALQTTLSQPNNYVRYDLQRLGLKDGTLTVSLVGLENVTQVGSPKQYTLTPLQTVTDSIAFSFSPTLEGGNTVRLLLQLSNGIGTHTDTLTYIYGTEETILSNNANTFNGFSNLSNSTWGETTQRFVSAPAAITDSPNTNYENDALNTVALSSPIALTANTGHYLRYWAQWDIEPTYDYVQVWASTNGGATRVPLCGKYTKPGGANQDFNNPLYEGNSDWVAEEVDLSDYAGVSNLTVGFTLRSDGFVQEDGFYFDDLSIVSINDSVTATLALAATDFVWQLQPNPAATQITVYCDAPTDILQKATLSVYTATGQLQAAYKGDAWRGSKLAISVADWQAGMYYYQLQSEKGDILVADKIVVGF